MREELLVQWGGRRPPRSPGNDKCLQRTKTRRGVHFRNNIVSFASAVATANAAALELVLIALLLLILPSSYAKLTAASKIRVCVLSFACYFRLGYNFYSIVHIIIIIISTSGTTTAATTVAATATTTTVTTTTTVATSIAATTTSLSKSFSKIGKTSFDHIYSYLSKFPTITTMKHKLAFRRCRYYEIITNVNVYIILRVFSTGQKRSGA